MKHFIRTLSIAGALLLQPLVCAEMKRPSDYSNVTYVPFDDVAISSGDTVDKRTAGGVYICTDPDWKGTCGYKVQPLNNYVGISDFWVCVVLTSPWYHTISAMGPDQGGWIGGYTDNCCGCTCQSNNCELLAMQLHYPGTGDLSTKPNLLGGTWDNALGSFFVFAE
ncbi:hypothetical protein BX600DRAFT_510094 [Xylariales sp. PMI_506]|nr:hypothetical protein BX600DRAFT_510094 [Xylariales sp. PMI_506]